MTLSPDNLVLWEWKWVVLNGTLVYSWIVMALLVLFSYLVTRNLTSGLDLSGPQNLLESIVEMTRNQIRDIIRDDPEPYTPFIGALFLFISVSNLLSVVPGFRSPAESLSTTTALAVCVFFAVPVYSIYNRGPIGFLKRYLEPSPWMLPFHLIGEVSRTLALSIRLFGNVMSGALMVGILLSIAPLLFPVMLQMLGLIIGQIQAYIFAVLATVYIASALRVQRETDGEDANESDPPPGVGASSEPKETIV
jgi:F-type H+-transporting ATPase subunit a